MNHYEIQPEHLLDVFGWGQHLLGKPEGFVEACQTPVAADILNRVISAGLVEAPPERVQANAAALGRVIAQMEG